MFEKDKLHDDSTSQREALIRVSQYVFRRESRAIGEDCRDNIVEMILYLSENKGLKDIEIKERIEKEFNFQDFPIFLVLDSLNRLTNVKKSCKITDGKYFLQKDRYSHIGAIVKERRRILDSMLQKLVDETRKHYPEPLSYELEEEIKRYFLEFLASWFILNSKFVASLMLNRKVMLIPKPPPAILENILKPIKNGSLRIALRKSIVEMSRKLEKEFSEFLFEMARNFLHIELLNLDPECRLLEKEAFSRKLIILDTNVIMSLFLPSRPTHETIRQVLTLSKSFGVKFAITKRTKKEWLNVLEKANERYKILKGVKPEILKVVNDDFIQSYFIETSKLSSLTWDGYYLQMKRLEIKLKNYEIEFLYKKKYEMEDLTGTEIFNKIDERTRYCASLVGNTKNKEVSEHDTLHLLLIRKLREEKPSDMLGPQYWFLTLDTSLPCVDQAINEEMLCHGDPPSSLLLENWLELITPFLGPEITATELPEIFATLMKTHFAALPTTINPNDLIEILGPWLNYESLTSEDIQSILGDYLVQECISKLRETRIVEPSNVENVQRKLFEVVERKVSQILNEKLKETKKREKEIKTSLFWERKFWRAICGGFGILFVILSIPLFYANNLFPAVLMVITGVCLLLLSLAYKYIRIKFGPVEMEARE